MNHPFNIQVKIKVKHLTKRFKKTDVQTIITDRLYQAADAILKALDLDKEYEVINVGRCLAYQSSFIRTEKGKANSTTIEAVLYAAPTQRHSAEAPDEL